jgi:hypothetical protein
MKNAKDTENIWVNIKDHFFQLLVSKEN